MLTQYIGCFQTTEVNKKLGSFWTESPYISQKSLNVMKAMLRMIKHNFVYWGISTAYSNWIMSKINGWICLNSHGSSWQITHYKCMPGNIDFFKCFINIKLLLKILSCMIITADSELDIMWTWINKIWRNRLFKWYTQPWPQSLK